MNSTTVAVIALTLIPTYIISGRKKTTQADWEVADRSLPLYVVIGTQFASAMGGGILVAHVGNAYARGIGHFIYGVLASLPFIIIMVLAKWLRRNNFTTIPDVLAHFTNGNKLIRIVAGVMTVFVPFGWVTSQITAFGNIYSNLTGIDYTLLCVLFAVFALAFVMPSGLKTVAWAAAAPISSATSSRSTRPCSASRAPSPIILVWRPACSGFLLFCPAA